MMFFMLKKCRVTFRFSESIECFSTGVCKTDPLLLIYGKHTITHIFLPKLALQIAALQVGGILKEKHLLLEELTVHMK